jgi:hypothetical protein
MRWLIPIVMVAGTAAADPLPKLADVKTLAFQQGQGGPALVRCDAVVYMITIDVATNAWTLGMCPYDPKKSDKLAITKGKLTAAERSTLETDYAALDAIADSKACGNDGGTLALVVTTKDGHKSSYVDLNWGCRKPLPVTVPKLKDLAGKLLTTLLAK